MVRRLEFRRMVAKRGRLARVGLAVVRVPQESCAMLGFLSSVHGMSEEDQATFKRNMGPHGGDDVSSIEGDNPGGIRVADSAETPRLSTIQVG